jgi:hypothetical protein
MEQKSAVVWLDSSFGFKPVLEQSQVTRPRQQLGENSPNQRNHMEPAKNRAGSCEQGAEDHPQDEQRMQDEDETRKA